MHTRVLIACLVTVAFFAWFITLVVTKVRTTHAERKVLVIGAPDSGKTALTHVVCGYEYPSTVSSVKASCLPFKFPSKAIEIWDCPLQSVWRPHLKTARQLIVTIDSSWTRSNMTSTAGLLNEMLCNEFVIKRDIPIYICITKADALTARKGPALVSDLQLELNSLTATEGLEYDLSSFEVLRTSAKMQSTGEFGNLLKDAFSPPLRKKA